MVSLEKHQNPAGNVNDLKGPNGEHDPWETHRVTLQDRIIAAWRRFRAISRLVGVVLGLPPSGQRRKRVAGPLTAAAGRKLPDSRQVMRVQGKRRSLIRRRRPLLSVLSHRGRRERQNRRQHTNPTDEAISHFRLLFKFQLV